MTRQIAGVGAKGFIEPLHELGFVATGRTSDNPRELLIEAIEAERLGFGSVFVSERFSGHDSATLTGALAAATSRIGIGVATTNHHLRHPAVAATHAITMHKLSGGRYCFGLGRGSQLQSIEYGLTPITTAQMADFAWLMRRLWAGETVVDHAGPAGRFPRLTVGHNSPERIPLMLSGFGPKTLTMAGRIFDSVVLHPFFTERTTRQAVATVRHAAEQAGRDPLAVRIWSVVATAGLELSPDDQRRKVVGWLANQLQANGDLLIKANDWDPAVLDRFRRDLFVGSFNGPIGGQASDSELDHVQSLIPADWIDGAAYGSRRKCAAKVACQLEFGVDGVLLMGAAPRELEPVVDEYRRHRDHLRFARLSANPALLTRRVSPTSESQQS